MQSFGGRIPQPHSKARWVSLSSEPSLTKAKPVFLGEDTGCGRDLAVLS